MKKILLIIGIVASLALVSCKERKAPENNTSTQASAAGQIQDDIVKGTLTNKEGVTLNYEFNNTKSTAVFTLNGEDIRMKQDTMASGIQYSNDHYKYVEHQGTMTLTKDGEVIFKK